MGQFTALYKYSVTNGKSQVLQIHYIILKYNFHMFKKNQTNLRYLSDMVHNIFQSHERIKPIDLFIFSGQRRLTSMVYNIVLHMRERDTHTHTHTTVNGFLFFIP
ncbi:hypothetical protein KIL84_003297 [Mauremys mutica]|uniref:Uncharacterized protein n=1 Tax=Mauremys mutica TaxID=74926 RepID=A0A9D3WP77_9SAUR|nr:hypothetical protein KIL84_003297 [Mauremys mutica]